MAACILCREESASSTRTIDIFSVDGVRLNICSIISKHFWLKPNNELCEGEIICLACWETLSAFDQFYQRVAEAHNHLESKDLFLVDAEHDPFGQEAVLKSEELSSAGQLVEALGENFFDSEIKVEVHDLDLLPQIEVIEDKQNESQRTLRAKRRGRPAKETAAAEKSSPTSKRKLLKREVATAVINEDDSEHELPLSALLNTSGMKAVVPRDTLQEPLNEVLSNKDDPAGDQPKKRRGRPKKVKEEVNEDNEKQNISPIKMERRVSESDDNDCADGREFLAAGLDVGTDDSASSSSSSTESDCSLPDVEPQEKYAEIPKRVVVKPKKYRKRQKPLVPPKRMTREEIDQKNAQQAEYDKILKQFFQKFNCPKCNLLVVDFGTMKKHFNASHNDSGYLLCCGKKFFQRKTLAEHIYVHWNPEHFKCSKCDKICQDSRTLELHEISHTQPPEIKDKKTFQCDKCPKFFSTKAAFEYHTFSKHVPKSEFKFSCPECTKKFPTTRTLKEHEKKSHDPKSRIICDKCGKEVRQSYIKKHQQLEHSDVPKPDPDPVQCQICFAWFRHESGLKQHIKIMHDDSGREYRCPICNRISPNARALKRHVHHNHECERKYKCTMCEKAFKRPQELKEHTSVHTGEVLYTCPNCPMTFFCSANMYKHRQRIHRAEYEAGRKNPRPQNIMQLAVGVTEANKAQQSVGSNAGFFAKF